MRGSRKLFGASAWLGKVRIRPDRVLDDLHKLRSFGAAPGYDPAAKGGDGVPKGVIRPALTPPDIEARHWLMDRAAEAGLAPSMDRIGNTLATGPSGEGKRLLCGSHSDSQPQGGWLDGALGVVFALEAARAVAEAGGPAAIDVVNFQDEEGRFGSLVGSTAFCRGAAALDLDAVSSSPEAAAPRVTFGAAIEAAGLVAKPLHTLADHPGRWLGFFEAHIEQGSRLERLGYSASAVSAIVGLRQYTLHFTGAQNHAGTTTMDERKDAAMACFRFAAELDARFAAIAAARAGTAVWTCGQVEVLPGAPSIVPGAARLTVQFRDPVAATLDALEQCLSALIAEHHGGGPCSVTVSADRLSVPPAQMDAELRGHVEAAAADHCPAAWITHHSGAIHDAGNLSTIMPAAMLFVPSIGGISHDFTEDTSESDIAVGAQVYASAAARMLAPHYE